MSHFIALRYCNSLRYYCSNIETQISRLFNGNHFHYSCSARCDRYRNADSVSISIATCSAALSFTIAVLHCALREIVTDSERYVVTSRYTCSAFTIVHYRLLSQRSAAIVEILCKAMVTRDVMKFEFEFECWRISNVFAKFKIRRIVGGLHRMRIPFSRT